MLVLRSFSGWIACACVCLSFNGTVMAQASEASLERIEAVRAEIKVAEEQHATDVQLGALWLRLANRYQDQLEFGPAEDAFARSLRLLRAPAVRKEYADALDGMGSLYFAMGRLSEAKDILPKALAIYEKLGEHEKVAALHETMAMELLDELRYREAETESAKGLAEFQLIAQPDPVEEVAAYLTHSYALCYQGRCAEGLEDANRAMAIARARRPAESLEMVAAWLVRGFTEWKTGSVEEGEREMGEALRLARGLTDLPRPVEIGAQLGVLRQYEALLKATHRKPEAKQVELEMGQLESEQPSGCNGCTVSAAALAPGLTLR